MQAPKRVIARARVKKAGRTIVVCDADAWAITGDEEKLVASMTGTMMCVTDRPELRG